MAKLKSIDYKILAALMKNSKTSDRQLAKEIGVSQPTVTRKRARLEREGLLEYTAIPNLGKLGYQIMAISFSKWTAEALTQLLQGGGLEKQVNLFLAKHPNVIFGATGGSGLGGMDSVSISIHRNYAEYSSWVKDIRESFGKYVETFDSYLVGLHGNSVVRQLTFKHFSHAIKSTES